MKDVSHPGPTRDRVKKGLTYPGIWSKYATWHNGHLASRLGREARAELPSYTESSFSEKLFIFCQDFWTVEV